MKDSSSTTYCIKDLLDTLRVGLAALVPVVERVAIPWNESDAYDDWEAIASTLYEQIVVNTIRNADEVDDNLAFTKYDLVYPSYGNTAYFEVLKQGKVLGPFVGFEASEPQFMNVKYAVVDSDRAGDATTTGVAAFAECDINLRVPATLGREIRKVSICE